MLPALLGIGAVVYYCTVPKIRIEDILNRIDINIYYDNNSNNIRSHDIIIHNKQALDDFLNGSLGFFESYMKGYWSCRNLEHLITKLEQGKINNTDFLTTTDLISLALTKLRIKVTGFTEEDSKLVGLVHYDLPRKLYEQMLGPSMIYSCAYFKNTDNLDIAQSQKMDLIARKLKLKPGMKVLDIGCGWGTLAYYLATRYQVDVTAITISKEQYNYCVENYYSNSDSNVNFLLQDYRTLEGSYDRIVSVGMFEHVTSASYDEYFEVCHKILNSGGLFLLHTITGTQIQQFGEVDPFIGKYIFPHGQIPHLSQISIPSKDKFVIEDVHNFGQYYAKTLLEWRKNFNNITNIELNETFKRMWYAYLVYCQIGFERNRLFLHQVVLSKERYEIYEAVR